MQPSLEAVDQGMSWFEQIQQHDSAMAVCLAVFGSWFITYAAAFFFRMWQVSPRLRIVTVRMFDIAVAFAICGWMWPYDHDLIWAAVVGAFSPLGYKIASWLLGKFAPGLAPKFELHELLADPPPPRPEEDTEQL